MFKKILLLLIFTSTSLFSQSNWGKFKQLSTPKKVWVFFHPFKAKKALLISKEAYRVADSIQKSPLLDGDASGGQVDAFRHAFWMARLRQKIGKKAARSLGRAHEKENYQTFQKRKLEDGVVPDKISSSMDLFNNDVGLTFTKKGSVASKEGLIYQIINAIHQGRLKIIKKDKRGKFLTCKGAVISNESLQGKWVNNKCLVFSNKKS
ncbi:hypothetical protein SAMN04487765_1137 [Tenacibaculum sp. MAR_2010_89]|uniref:DUF6973 domain-containing protein n=1 Tax=Tenacibaculum sp. MAR_2010_89 TaxID=1250198 RepID=UPI00089A7BB8|nr:hypothetical protein [Tenacibaculum sp. MAR_2010_89]SEE02380.1 hypothetical protein SAMN04487765_1137 [Tenacibaculum sp. MAR_2010_89]